MKKPASVLKFARFAGWSVGALVLAAAGAVAVNAFDEPLSVEARRLAAGAEQPHTEARNAYVWMLGLHAPATEDAYAWGARILTRLQDADARREPLDQQDPLL